MSEARLGIQLGVVLGGIALVAACSTTPVQVPSRPPVTPEPIADGMLRDEVGDLILWPDEKPVRTPEYLDIRELEAVADATTLRLTLTLVGTVPVPPPPERERLNYNIALLTDGNIHIAPNGRGGHTFVVSLSNSNPSKGFQPVLWDLPFDSEKRAISYWGHEFPGTVEVAGGTIVWTVRLAALGVPDVIQLSASTASTATTGSGDKFSVTDQFGVADLDVHLTLDLAGGRDRPRPS